MSPTPKDAIAAAHMPMLNALKDAVAGFAAQGHAPDRAAALASALLIREAASVLASAGGAGRMPEARTFETMFDLDGSLDHFQDLVRGLQQGAQQMEHDGYGHGAALVLVAGRAMEAVADVLRDDRP